MLDILKNSLAITAVSHAGITAPIPFDGGEGSDEGGDGGTPLAGSPPSSLLGGDKSADGDKPDDGDNKNDGDKKPADDNSDDKKSEDDDDSGQGKKKTEPEPETLALSAPEGFEDYQGEFDKFAADMDPWLKENPEATPKDILAEAARRQAQLVADQTKESAEAFNSQMETWENEAKADKEIGGDNYDANVGVAVKAIEAFGNQALKDVLNQSGLGNHPEVIRFAMKAGAQLKEAPVLKGASASQNMSLEDALYKEKKT